TPLHQAVISRNQRIFDLLLKQPSLDTNLRTLSDEHPPLYYALVDDRRASISSSETLVMNGSNPFDTPVTNKNAFTEDPVEGKTDSVVERGFAAKLLEKGCDSAVFLACHLSGELNHTNEAGVSALHAACANGLARLTAAMLEHGARPNLQTAYGEQEDTVYSNHEGAVLAIIEHKRLVEKGDAPATDKSNVALSPNLNLKNSEGDTPVSHKNLVAPLIEGGADGNIRNGKGTEAGETPLQLAIHCRLGLVVEALCVRGVDMSKLDANGVPPLWAALDSGQDEVASILVRNGADADCWGPGPDGCLQTLLHKAIDENKEALATFLIRSGCDVESPRRLGASGEGASDSEGKTPLHIAIENQHAAIITLVLSQPGVDLSARDARGKCDMESVMFLLSVEVDVNSRVQDATLAPPLHLAASAGNEVLLRSLLLAGARPNDRDAHKRTALHVAAQAGHASIISALVSGGAEYGAVDAGGDNALHICARDGHAPAARALLADTDVDAAATNLKGRDVPRAREGGRVSRAGEQGGTLHIQLSSNTPLLLAYMHGQGVMCRVLVKAGACLAQENKEGLSIFNYQCLHGAGNTPLLLAYMHGQGAMCRVLVKAGACLAQENKEGLSIFNYQCLHGAGNTPLLLAYMHGQGAMCRVLSNASKLKVRETRLLSERLDRALKNVQDEQLSHPRKLNCLARKSFSPMAVPSGCPQYVSGGVLFWMFMMIAEPSGDVLHHRRALRMRDSDLGMSTDQSPQGAVQNTFAKEYRQGCPLPSQSPQDAQNNEQSPQVTQLVSTQVQSPQDVRVRTTYTGKHNMTSKYRALRMYAYVLITRENTI
ncbi:Ankyrin repeat and FYVE domain-containing protein 1, partial [Operophtera brumata]